MNHDDHSGRSDHSKHDGYRGFFASRGNVVLVVFLAVGGFYLISEHTAHLVGYGPLVLLLLLCGGMHVFMHGSHGHGEHGDGEDRRAIDSSDEPDAAAEPRRNPR